MLNSSRRHFIRASGAWLVTLPTTKLWAKPRFSAYPFSLGVASGYPTANSVVLWTRLAPEPLTPGGGMSPVVVPVKWEIAADAGMKKIIQKGTAYATPEWAHSLHVEVLGLEPARWYWYRFMVDGAASPIGRTRSAPAVDAANDKLRFAFASCQHYEQGYFTAYRHMREDELDLIIHLGDYIYESSWGRDHVRKHLSPEPHTLEDYRIRYALYRSDADLQAAHAYCPWLVTWDDHEVDNDYADALSQDNDVREWFLLRRAAAYKAYYEHMPLPRRMVPMGPYLPLYTRVNFGSLAEFYVLDDRQYRSPQVCPRPGRAGSNTIDEEKCPERLDAQRSLLGVAQEKWLEAGLNSSKAKWNVLAQQTIVAQLDNQPGVGKRFWTDGWDGYPASRKRLLDFLAQRKPANPVFIGGDVHSFNVGDLKLDFADPNSPTVASEFVGTSITSQSWPQSRIAELLPDNPHIRFAHSEYRGYVRMELSAKRLTADLRALNAVNQKQSTCSTLAAFVVEDGKAGPQRA